MSQYEVLNKERHKALRIQSGFGKTLGDATMFVSTFALEFRDIQSCYPILFTKDPNSGEFHATAVLGFESEQNLFLHDDGWDAAYIPAMTQRQPFLIATGGDSNNPVVSIDLDHPRVGQERGEALFDDKLEASNFLTGKIAVLEKLHRGLQHNKGYIEALLKYELIEPITLDLTFANGDSRSLQGFYCIAEDRLYRLGGDVLGELNQAGYLQPCFMAVASLSRMRDLIERRNRLYA